MFSPRNVSRTSSGSYSHMKFSRVDDAQTVCVELLGGEEVVKDDDDATIVMVFAKSVEVGGTVDPAEEIYECAPKFKKIFMRRQNPDASEEAIELSHEIAQMEADEWESATTYHGAVRNRVLYILREQGVKVAQFDSIDGDESFLKLSLKRDGEAIRRLAEAYYYKLALRHDVYSACQPEGAYAGGEPMTNNDGEFVPAFVPYNKDGAPHLVDFRFVDEARLLEMFLNSWMHLPEMIEQKVIVKWYVSAKAEQMAELNAEWSGLHRTLSLPEQKVPLQVRDYFGERIAFFFMWFGFYTRMLGVLSLVGFVIFLRRFVGLSLLQQRCAQIVFSVFVICWASVFNKLFVNISARQKQEWGMKAFEGVTVDRAGYSPDLEGTWEQTLRSFFVRVAIVFFLVCYVGVIALLNYAKANRFGGGLFKTCSHVFILAWIKAGEYAWNIIAPKLTDADNHRTEARWTDGLVWMLASVELFVQLFPFVSIAFIKKWTDYECGANLVDVAWEVYRGEWPSGVAEYLSKQVPPQVLPAEGSADATSLDWLSHWTFQRDSPEYAASPQCVLGCYPETCIEDDLGNLNCITSCVKELEFTLLSLVIINLAMTVAYLVIPIIMVRRSVHKEQRDAEERGRGDDYSFLQMQAKCCDEAKYQFGSAGGSFVSDFMDLATSFMLLTCWSVALPVVVIPCFICNCISYRLLAFRMTNVTCRPEPRAAEGIGAWQWVFECITQLAILVNVGYMVFVMFPMRDWPLGKGCMAFIALEHLMLALSWIVKAMIPDEPHDVRRCEDFNTFRVSQLFRTNHPTLPKDEHYDQSAIKLGFDEARVRVS